jgi:predicted MFS family arabinose efflux permease
VALAIDASWMGRTIDRRDKRRLAITGIAIAAAASAVCLLPISLVPMLLARLAFGAGLGLIAAATNALPAGDPQPERLFALMQVGLAALFSILMFVSPPVMLRLGGAGLFAVELVFILVIGLLAPLLPRAVGQTDVVTHTTDRLPLGAGRGLLAMAFMLIAQGTCWAFAEQAASVVGIAGSQLGLLFTASALLMLGGAIGATTLGMKLGMNPPLLLGFGVQMLVALGMYCVKSPALFIGGVLALNAAGSFTLPYIQGVLSDLDESGRSASLSGAAINFGAAAGPAISAALSIFSGLAPIGFVTAIILCAAIALVMSAARTHHRQPLATAT